MFHLYREESYERWKFRWMLIWPNMLWEELWGINSLDFTILMTSNTNQTRGGQGGTPIYRQKSIQNTQNVPN